MSDNYIFKCSVENEAEKFLAVAIPKMKLNSPHDLFVLLTY